MDKLFHNLRGATRQKAGFEMRTNPLGERRLYFSGMELEIIYLQTLFTIGWNWNKTHPNKQGALVSVLDKVGHELGLTVDQTNADLQRVLEENARGLYVIEEREVSATIPEENPRITENEDTTVIAREVQEGQD